MNRYFTYRSYLKRQFSKQVFKIPLDAGMTCPNRDGRVAVGGCTYCDNASFSPHIPGPSMTIARQLEEGIRFYRGRRFGGERFIAYFQSYTNTYAPTHRLRLLYDEALAHPDIIGLSVATRPDCVGDEILDLLSEYHRKTHLFLEIGLQSMHDETLRRVNRGHTFSDFTDAVKRIKRRGMRLCVHIILGLPGENKQQMLETARVLSSEPIDAVKITHLYVPVGAPLADAYRRGEVSVLGLEEYLELVCDVLESLPSHVVIERLMGELSGPDILAPRWGATKAEILRGVEAVFERRGTRQGSAFKCRPEAW